MTVQKEKTYCGINVTEEVQNLTWKKKSHNTVESNLRISK